MKKIEADRTFKGGHEDDRADGGVFESVVVKSGRVHSTKVLSTTWIQRCISGCGRYDRGKLTCSLNGPENVSETFAK